MKMPNLGSLPVGLRNPSDIIDTQDLTLLHCPFLGRGLWASPPLPHSLPWFPPPYWIISWWSFLVPFLWLQSWWKTSGQPGVLGLCRQKKPQWLDCIFHFSDTCFGFMETQSKCLWPALSAPILSTCKEKSPCSTARSPSWASKGCVEVLLISNPLKK